MRILVVTNYYPPSNYGWGYMQLCEEVVDGLSSRGHDAAVLTSTRHDGPEIPRPYPVHRLVTIDPNWNGGKSAAWQFLVGRRWREKQALGALRRVVEQFRPEVIFVWHYIGLSRVMLAEAERLGDATVAYYLAGYHPELPDEYIAYWRRAPVHPVAKLLKPPLSRLALAKLRSEGKPIHLSYENVVCVSRYVRDRLVSKGLIPSKAAVIHNGVDLSVFSTNGLDQARFASDILRCLVAGHIIPEKGIHTVIDALAALDLDTSASNITLTVLGDGQKNYLQALKAKVRSNGLQDVVQFKPPVPRDEMPGVLDSHDVLILASEYDEPLARAMQEGMGMGLLVIGTTTGGSGELLVHGETGLAFEAGDPESLASQLSTALQHPQLASRLALSGRRKIRGEFNIRRTIDQIESYLLGLVNKEE